MKRTNSVTNALNTESADIDLGDGLSMRLPLGDITAVIGGAATGALRDAKTYTDGATDGSSTKPINLDGTEDVKALGSAEYRVGSSTAAVALGLPSPGHGFLTVSSNSASRRVEWRDVSPADPATWVLQLAGGKWSEWKRTDGLQALSDSRVYTDAAKLAAIEASMGPKVVAIDTDGTPYYSPTGGTHRIFLDADNVPYFTLTPWPVAGADASGTPIVTF